MESSWNHFFKPEVRKRGDEDLTKGLVTIANFSDIQIQAYVKTHSLTKVSLSSASIEASVFFAQCSCSSFKKHVLCRHIWAVIQLVKVKHPDFLEEKKQIELLQYTASTESKRETAYKSQQKEYKSQQYQKQKARAAEQRKQLKEKLKNSSKPEKDSRSLRSSALAQTPEVAAALKFFALNGFPLENLTDEELKNAKKILARVFHPDKGGTHEEFLTLNQHYEALLPLVSE